jgi:hypothetical protein
MLSASSAMEFKLSIELDNVDIEFCRPELASAIPLFNSEAAAIDA